MMLGKFFLSLPLSAPISAKYLTITAGSSDITTTQCKTLVGILSKESVPTYTFSRTALLPEIVLALAVSTPGSTVTPPAVTATNTLQTYTTTTITASTATGTFSTTATIFETDSTTTTETVVSTTTSTTTSTSTAVVTVPAPTDWIPVKNSTGLKDREDQAILPGSEIQQPLEDDGSRVEGGWPPGIPNPPGIPKRKDPWEKLHPLSVTCKQALSMPLFKENSYCPGFQTVRTRYVKMIVFIKPYATTTTIPPATSTTTSIQTVSFTSTIVPYSVTVIKSFSTTSTTTTTLTSVVTDIASATELVNATTTTTTYATCFTENQLGQRLADGWTIGTVSINDLTTRQDIQAINSTYDCCVSCLLSDQNCQYSTILFHQNPPLCGRLLNPAICRGQDYDAGEIKEYPDALKMAGQSVSNGPCGKAVYTDNRPPLNRPADGPPSAGMVEL